MKKSRRVRPETGGGGGALFAARLPSRNMSLNIGPRSQVRKGMINESGNRYLCHPGMDARSLAVCGMIWKRPVTNLSKEVFAARVRRRGRSR